MDSPIWDKKNRKEGLNELEHHNRYIPMHHPYIHIHLLN